jgi:hypothetical protein
MTERLGHVIRMNKTKMANTTLKSQKIEEEWEGLD